MESTYLEHANITFNNLEKAIQFFQTAFPNYLIRGEGIVNGRKWVHLGTNDSYLALNQALTQATNEKYYSKAGINHLGFVVDQVNELAERLLKAGYKRDYPRQEETFRIREYFVDNEGNEYEFVQYLSNNPQERNAYSEP